MVLLCLWDRDVTLIEGLFLSFFWSKKAFSFFPIINNQRDVIPTSYLTVWFSGLTTNLRRQFTFNCFKTLIESTYAWWKWSRSFRGVPCMFSNRLRYASVYWTTKNLFIKNYIFFWVQRYVYYNGDWLDGKKWLYL